MIIVCPSCATSYDVEDDRFSPNGRSVRCAACDCSWFVPAPEPVENLVRRTGESRSRIGESRRSAPDWRADEADDADIEEEIEALFEDRGVDPARGRDRGDRGAASAASSRQVRDAPAREAVRWDTDRADEARRSPADDSRPQAGADERREDPAFPLRRRHRLDDDETGRRGEKRFRAPDRDPEGKVRRERARSGLKFFDDRDEADDRGPVRSSRPDRRRDAVVDADWEDIDEPKERDRDYDRGVSGERRRARALAEADAFASLDPNILDKEFYASLRVQPKELEKALLKARRRAEARDKNRLTPWRALGWFAWIAAVSATVFVAYVYRNEVVRFWPNTAGAYAIIGIEANPYGLAIEDVRHRLAMSTAGPTIEITGKLHNIRDVAVKPPLLQAEALGPRGKLLSRWTFKADGDEVLAGDAIDFITRAPAPEGVAEVALSFAPEKGGVVSVGDFLTRR